MKDAKILLEVKRLIKFYNLTKKTNEHEYAFRRFYLCHFMRYNTELTLASIRDMFGFKHHSSVIWGADKHESFTQTNDEKYRDLIAPLMYQLTAKHKPVDIDEATRELIRASQLKLN